MKANDKSQEFDCVDYIHQACRNSLARSPQAIKKNTPAGRLNFKSR